MFSGPIYSPTRHFLCFQSLWFIGPSFGAQLNPKMGFGVSSRGPSLVGASSGAHLRLPLY